MKTIKLMLSIMVVIVIATFVSSCVPTKEPFSRSLTVNNHLTPETYDSLQYCNGPSKEKGGQIITLKKLYSPSGHVIQDGILFIDSLKNSSIKTVPIFTLGKLLSYNTKTKLAEITFGKTKIKKDTINLVFGPDTLFKESTNGKTKITTKTIVEIFYVLYVLDEKQKEDVYVHPIPNQKIYRIKSGDTYYQVTSGLLTKLFISVKRKTSKPKADPGLIFL
jgi:hypothetical protein